MLLFLFLNHCQQKWTSSSIFFIFFSPCSKIIPYQKKTTKLFLNCLLYSCSAPILSERLCLYFLFLNHCQQNRLDVVVNIIPLLLTLLKNNSRIEEDYNASQDMPLFLSLHFVGLLLHFAGLSLGIQSATPNDSTCSSSGL